MPILPQKAKNLGRIRALLFGVWLTLVVAVGIAYRYQGRLFAVEGKPIARLVQKRGFVQSRSEDLVTWRDIQIKHGFFEGDRVATGVNSRARIMLAGGREILLGEDSQVAITAIEQGDDYSFIVSLLKGSVEGSTRRKTAKGSLPMTIRSGAKTVTIETGEAIGLVKPVGAPAREFKAKELPVLQAAVKIPDAMIPAAPAAPVEPPLLQRAAPPVPTLVPTPTPETVKLPSFATAIEEVHEADDSASEPAPAPKASAPKPPGRAKDFIPKLSKASSERSFWALAPLASLTSTSLEFSIEPPAKAAPEETWRPLLEISPVAVESKNLNRLLIPGRGFRKQTLLVPIGTLLKHIKPRERNGLPELNFEVRTGAKLSKRNADDGESTARNQAFSRVSATIQVKAFGDVGEEPISLALDSMNVLPNFDARRLISPKASQPVAGAPFVIHLFFGTKLKKLMPLVAGANAVTITRQPTKSAAGTFVVAGKRVIAKLEGAGMTQERISTLAKILGGDFVFTGERGSFLETNERSSFDVARRVEALLDQGKVLYVLERGKLFPVNREFIRSSAEVARFIESNAKALFVSPVEVAEVSQ